jgi:hypothetical protein
MILSNNQTSKQQDLYNKYYTLNQDVQSRIKNLKSNLPSFEEKVNTKKQKLKKCRINLTY